jgi:hypothetical protein
MLLKNGAQRGSNFAVLACLASSFGIVIPTTTKTSPFQKAQNFSSFATNRKSRGQVVFSLLQNRSSLPLDHQTEDQSCRTKNGNEDVNHIIPMLVKQC